MADSKELDGLLEPFLSSADCDSCRLCCYFHDDDKHDAPLLDDRQREELETLYPERLRFTQKGDFWQIVLESVDADAAGQRYVCPLLDRKTHLCTARTAGVTDIFDCRTWPFQVMQQGERTVFTVSCDCPKVAPRLRSNRELRVLAMQSVLPRMLEVVKEKPDLLADITSYNEGQIEVLNPLEADSE